MTQTWYLLFRKCTTLDCAKCACAKSCLFTGAYIEFALPRRIDILYAQYRQNLSNFAKFLFKNPIFMLINCIYET